MRPRWSFVRCCEHRHCSSRLTLPLEIEFTLYPLSPSQDPISRHVEHYRYHIDIPKLTHDPSTYAGWRAAIEVALQLVDS
jgi:hypothetical protein